MNCVRVSIPRPSCDREQWMNWCGEPSIHRANSKLRQTKENGIFPIWKKHAQFSHSHSSSCSIQAEPDRVVHGMARGRPTGESLDRTHHTTNISNHHHTTIDSRASNVAKRLPKELYIMFGNYLLKSCSSSASSASTHKHHCQSPLQRHNSSLNPSLTTNYNHYNHLQKPPHSSKCFPSSSPPLPPSKHQNPP